MEVAGEARVEPSAVGSDDPAEASSGEALPPHSQVALSDDDDTLYQPTQADWAEVEYLGPGRKGHFREEREALQEGGRCISTCK